jgi:hypothetical protein
MRSLLVVLRFNVFLVLQPDMISLYFIFKYLTWPLSTYSFSDSVRRRCSVLQWNPDVATQLVVASDEDSSPSVRVLTMRLILLH